MKKTFNYKNNEYLFEDYDDDHISFYGVDYGMYVSKLNSSAIAIFPGDKVLNYCDINCELNQVSCAKLIENNFYNLFNN